MHVYIVGSAAEEAKHSVVRALAERGVAASLASQDTHKGNTKDALTLCLDAASAQPSATQPPTLNYDYRYVWTSDNNGSDAAAEVVEGLASCLHITPAQLAAYLPGQQHNFCSTRGGCPATTFLAAVREGLASDGGLYMLHPLPRMPASQLHHFCTTASLSYVEAAQCIVEQLVDSSLPASRLRPLLQEAYDPRRWSGLHNICPVTPLLLLDDVHKEGNAVGQDMAWAAHVALLELYHGPTAAFKDFALQLFPRYFNVATSQHHEKSKDEEEEHTSRTTNNNNDDAQYLILAATSGDTGVAAISGFVNAGGRAKVMVLYPMHGVSPVQQLQMLSFDDGARVEVFGVDADFDFCQKSVKTLFADTALNRTLAARRPPVHLSSANSINWGRLIPQVVYYFWAYRAHAQQYLRIQQQEQREQGNRNEEGEARHVSVPAGWRLGDAMDIVVPCGNFGNILAAYVAKLMGLPVHKLIVASNQNDVLYDFVRTGTYDIRHRHLAQTASPSIDILKASNVERFLYLLSDGDAPLVASYMQSLEREGQFTITAAMRARMQDSFWAGRCDEAECAQTIHEVFVHSRHRRLLDPHTAVAVRVAQLYRTQQVQQGQEATKDAALLPLVIASTAHWAKFPEPVLHAIRGEKMALGSPQPSAAAAVRHVRDLYERILAEATANNNNNNSTGGEAVRAHLALAAAMATAEHKAQQPRALAAVMGDVQAALETFAAV